MVCVPCFIVPVLLIIWRFIIRPIFVKFFKFGVKTDENGKTIEPEFPIKCEGNVCPWKPSDKQKSSEKTNETPTEQLADEKKEN